MNESQRSVFLPSNQRNTPGVIPALMFSPLLRKKMLRLIDKILTGSIL